MEAQRLEAIERSVRCIGAEFSNYLNAPLTQPPLWEFARFENVEFRKRASRKVLGAVERWSAENLLVSAPTGAGKTAAALAWLHRMRDQTVTKVRAGEKATLPSFGFVTGPELAGCRRRSRIGEESPLVLMANRVDVLVLDEVGYEPDGEELFFVADHRLRRKAQTIITTGKTVAEFKGRYGEALYRRFIEWGAAVEVA